MFTSTFRAASLARTFGLAMAFGTPLSSMRAQASANSE
jgi:hypothetical protein